MPLVRASDPVDAETGLRVAFSDPIAIARATRWLKEHAGEAEGHQFSQRKPRNLAALTQCLRTRSLGQQHG
jgi:hypothetical protein